MKYLKTYKIFENFTNKFFFSEETLKDLCFDLTKQGYDDIDIEYETYESGELIKVYIKYLSDDYDFTLDEIIEYLSDLGYKFIDSGFTGNIFYFKFFIKNK